MRLVGGRYRLDEPVGEGGMAVVWRGYDLVLHRTVAVKMLWPQRTAERVLRERIRAEAHAAARLNHPNVASVYDFGEARCGGYRRVPYLVMEYVDGETLAVRLRTVSRLDWRSAVRIGMDVAAALETAHTHGLVHRDVKPGNVMLSPAGVRVVDFGVATAVGQDAVQSGNMVFATPAYMAPEQLGRSAATPASDVYALGLLLYECLTGVHPWPGTDAAGVLDRYRRGAVPEPPNVPGLPPPVSSLCLRCLAPEPAGRPTSTEARRILQEALGHPSFAGDPAGTLSVATGEPETDDTQPVTSHLSASPRPAGPENGHPAGSGWRSLASPAVPPLFTRPVAVTLLGVLAVSVGGLGTYAGRTASGTESARAALGAGVTAADARSRTHGTACVARYTVQPRPDGTFVAELAITNTGEPRARPWTVTLTLPSGQSLHDAGDVEWTQRRRAVALRVADDLAEDETVVLTLYGGLGDHPERTPDRFGLDGALCERAVVLVRSTLLAGPGARVPSDTVRTTDRRPGPERRQEGRDGIPGASTTIASSSATATTRPPDPGRRPDPGSGSRAVEPRQATTPSSDAAPDGNDPVAPNQVIATPTHGGNEP
jgi:serine/threonine-protein kinase